MCRCNNRVSHLSHLKGKRIAIGAEGDGTNVLAKALLNASGITAANSKLVSIDGETGKQHWLSLTRKGVRTLPQIFITQGEETIHIGELEDLIAWHTEAIKKSKEVELL